MSAPQSRAPLVVFMADLAPLVGVKSASAARRFVIAQGIPYVRLARNRMAVRTSTLDSWLAAREMAAEPSALPPVMPKPPAWAVELLRRGRRRGLGPAEARGSHPET